MRVSDRPAAGLLRDLFSKEVRVAASPLLEDASQLLAEERALVDGVASGREREVATGRWLARGLLGELGHADFALLRDEERVPIWPPDVVGSISHKHDLCAVAVARRRDRLGIGLDLERDEPVRAGLERMVCLPRERVWLGSAGASAAEAGRRCRALFSAKEAVYKAFFPRLRRVWGFHDVAVELDLEAQTFRARLPADADRAEVEGRSVRREGWILSAVEYA